VVDLAGGVVLPGFQDAHVHPVHGGIERMRCDLSGLATRAEYLARCGATSRPTRTGRGCSAAAGRCRRSARRSAAADLDAVVGDRPVFLPNRDHHGPG
jgi:predicted amidohydrolase YtcJ